MKQGTFFRGLRLGLMVLLGSFFLVGCGAKVEKRELPPEGIEVPMPSLVHSPEAIIARERLKVGISIDRGPYSHLNFAGDMEGVDAEIARAFALDLIGDMEAVDFFFYNEGTKEAQLLEDRVDLVLSMSQWKDNTLEDVTFFPIMRSDISVVSNEKSQIEKLEDMSGKTMVVIQNTPAQFLLSSSYPDIKLKEVVNFQEAYDLLIAGEVTGMAIDSPQAHAWAIENEGYEVAIPSLGYEYELGIGISKREEALAVWIKEVLGRFKSEGYLEHLYDEILEPIYQDNQDFKTRWIQE